MSKPPAFQFYAKDWLSSSTRLRMTRAERGLFWDMAAFAWDSEQPGTITMPIEDFAKLLGISLKVLRKFLKRFPKTFVKDSENGFKFTQPKLAEQWVNYREISEKRRTAAQSRYPANAQQKHHPASASSSASAFASASKDKEPQDAVVVEENRPTAVPSRELILAFQALGHKPFGDRKFQAIWLEEYLQCGSDPNWTDIMELVIQRCQKAHITVPGLFYKHKHEIENGQVKERYKVTPL